MAGLCGAMISLLSVLALIPLLRVLTMSEALAVHAATGVKIAVSSTYWCFVMRGVMAFRVGGAEGEGRRQVSGGRERLRGSCECFNARVHGDTIKRTAVHTHKHFPQTWTRVCVRVCVLSHVAALEHSAEPMRKTSPLQCLRFPTHKN